MTQDMTGLPYGENADFNEMQSSAPLAATPGAASNPLPTQPGGPAPTGMFTPSQRPDEPVTAGAPFGPGPGTQSMAPSPRRLSQVLDSISADSPEGDAAVMARVARRLGY